MKKIKLSNLLDYLLLFVLLFFISFIWARYVVLSLVPSSIIATCFSIITLSINVFINNKKQAKQNIKKAKQTAIEDCANFFLFNNFEENANFYKSMLENKYSVEIKNNFLYLENDIHKIALFLLFDVKKINQDQVVFCLKSVKKYDLTKIAIICNAYENNVLNISQNYKIKTEILNKQQNYNNILLIFNTFPQITEKNNVKEKLTFKFLLRNAIERKKFKTYFFGGLFLFFASLFVRYNIYYKVFASIMFMLSILCLFENKIYKKSKLEVL